MHFEGAGRGEELNLAVDPYSRAFSQELFRAVMIWIITNMCRDSCLHCHTPELCWASPGLQEVGWVGSSNWLVPVLQLRKPRLRKMKWFAQDYINWKRSWDANLDLLTPNLVLWGLQRRQELSLLPLISICRTEEGNPWVNPWQGVLASGSSCYFSKHP